MGTRSWLWRWPALNVGVALHLADSPCPPRDRFREDANPLKTSIPSPSSRRLVTFALALALGGFIAGLTGCGSSDVTPLAPVSSNPFDAYRVGTDSTFEVVTWNLHNFAMSAGATTVALAAEAIGGLDADVVALQEIAQPARFADLVGALSGWDGALATSNSYGQQLAYVWNANHVSLGPDGAYEIFAHSSREFPRPPLVLDLVWNGHPVLLIDNHLKCCGDGTLDAGDSGDEETRRRDACNLLSEWIASEAVGRAVIVMGDMNDLLTDMPANNVFTAFLDDPASYLFADMSVATGSLAGWSWGPGRSHLDHFVITDELFAAFAAPAATCHTARLDLALTSGEYQAQLSDHAPVVLRLDLDP